MTPTKTTAPALTTLRPAKGQQPHALRGDVGEAVACRGLGDPRNCEEPVDVIGDNAKSAAGDLEGRLGRPVVVAGPQPQPRRLRDDRLAAVMDAVPISQRGLGGEDVGVVGKAADLRALLVIDGVCIGDPDLGAESDAPRPGLVGQQLEPGQLPLHADDGKRLQRGRQPPQVRVHPGPYVVDVRSHVLQPRSDV
jgi:hypothetical protein